MRALIAAMVLLLGAGSACARRVPAPHSWSADAIHADRLVEAGCYNCLKEAFAIYEHGPTDPRTADAAQSAAFAAAVLLAAREKELGLEASPWIHRARTLLPSPEASTYAEIAEALRWETGGRSADFESTWRFNPSDLIRFHAFLRRPGANGVLGRYLRIAVACTYRQDLSEEIPFAGDAHSQPPAIQYRVGLCGLGHQAHLQAALAREPRLVEAHFFIGRYLLADSPDRLSRALPSLTAAFTDLPQVPLIAVTLAGVHQARREHARSLELCDHALGIRPTQRDAWLGRTIALTYMGRHDEAIAAATRLLELGTWHIGDAHYWRAWNQYQRRDLEAAARDVDAAKALMANSDVLTLSGLIAFDQRRLVEVKADFESARRFDAANCIAAWYLGLIHVESAEWVLAADLFAFATTCYRDTANGLRGEIERLPADLDPPVRQLEVADRERRISESLRQQARAAFNAAQTWNRLGDRSRAADFAKQAARHEEMREKAEALLKSLEQ